MKLKIVEEIRGDVKQGHKSGAAVAGEVARNQALKISRLFHEKIKMMVEIKL